jgi:hypothetical protein
MICLICPITSTTRAIAKERTACVATPIWRIPGWPVLTDRSQGQCRRGFPFVAKPWNYGSQPPWRQSKTANRPSISLDPSAARACGGVDLRRGRIPALIAIFQPPATVMALQHYDGDAYRPPRALDLRLVRRRQADRGHRGAIPSRGPTPAPAPAG